MSTHSSTLNRTTLVHLTRAATRISRQIYGVPSTCIHTSLALADVLNQLGIPASVLRVETIAHRPDPIPPRECAACTLGGSGDGSFRPRGNGWRGHLVTIVESRWLLDATVGQVNVSVPLIRAHAVVAEVTSAFLDGKDRLRVDFGPKSGWADYRRVPIQNGWRSTPACRPIQRRELVAGLRLFLDDNEFCTSTKHLEAVG